MNWKLRRMLYFMLTFVEASAVELVNRLRRMLGWTPPPHPTHTFLHQFLLHAIGRQRPLQVTCRNRTDGAGAQAHTMMAAICFARACGHTYVHTPFEEIAHAEAPMTDWVAAWERALNLGAGELSVGAEQAAALNYSSFHPRLYHAVVDAVADAAAYLGPPGAGKRTERHHFHPHFFFADSHPEAYLAVQPEFRRKFFRGADPADSLAADSRLNVAVHLRRGDVTPAHPRRYTPTHRVRRTLDRIRQCLEAQGKTCLIRVFSVGSESDFAELADAGAELVLNREAPWTLGQLARADVLVLSKSSFSYVAGLLSRGVVVYEPFWHAPLPGWICLDRHARFRCDRLVEAVAERMADRRFAPGEPGDS